MTRRRKKWVVLLTLGVLAVAGIVGTRLYVTSPGYRVRSLLEQAGGRPPSAFRSFLVKAHLARPDLQSPAIVPRIILIGRPAVAALTEALKAPDPNVRRLAIEAMGELAQGAEFEHVVVMLRDPDQNVRYSAMEVLGRVRYIPAIEPLAGMIATENNGSWFPAADALLAIGDARVARPLLQAGTADSALRRDLLSSPHAEQLARLGGPQVRGAFVQAMLVPSTLWVAEAGAEGLGMMHNPGAADDLLAVIERQHLFPRLLARVARSLGQIGDKRAVEPLARLLTDESVDVRLGASASLCRMGDRRGVSVLLDASDHAEVVSGDDYVFPEQREWAIELLGWANVPEARDRLVQLVKDKGESCRKSAIRALAASGDARAEGLCIEALSDKDWGCQVAAAEGLGKLGDKKALDPLVAALKDQVPDVRVAAVEALGKLGDPRAARSLIQLVEAWQTDIYEPELIGKAADVLGAWHVREAVDPLRRALDVSETISPNGGYIGLLNQMQLHVARALRRIEGTP